MEKRTNIGGTTPDEQAERSIIEDGAGAGQKPSKTSEEEARRDAQAAKSKAGASTEAAASTAFALAANEAGADSKLTNDAKESGEVHGSKHSPNIAYISEFAVASAPATKKSSSQVKIAQAGADDDNAQIAAPDIKRVETYR